MFCLSHYLFHIVGYNTGISYITQAKRRRIFHFVNIPICWYANDRLTFISPLNL